MSCVGYNDQTENAQLLIFAQLSLMHSFQTDAVSFSRGRNMFMVRTQADWGHEVTFTVIKNNNRVILDCCLQKSTVSWKFNQIMPITFFFFLYFVGSCELHGLKDMKMCLAEKQLIDTQLIDMCQWDI